MVRMSGIVDRCMVHRDLMRRKPHHDRKYHIEEMGAVKGYDATFVRTMPSHYQPVRGAFSPLGLLQNLIRFESTLHACMLKLSNPL